MDVTTFDDIPKSRQYSSLPIYKEGAANVLYWQIFVDLDKKIMTVAHGVLDSEMIQRKDTDLKTNLSGRSLEEQAFIDARSRYREKIRDGYSPEEDMKTEKIDVTIHPMLATVWKSEKEIRHRVSLFPVVNGKKLPAVTQPKIDGIRMIACVKSDGSIECRSRKNRTFPHLHALKKELAEFFPFLPDGYQVDGEMYIHTSFQELTSIVRTEKTDHPDIDKINYYIFDVIDPGTRLPYEKRYAQLKNAFSIFGDRAVKIHFVEASLIRSEKEIYEMHDAYVSLGYEGIIIRRIGTDPEDPESKLMPKMLELSKYIPRRGQNMFKYKNFQDEEMTIVGATEGEGLDKGAVIWEVEDKDKHRFQVRPRGTIEDRRKMFDNKKLYIGKSLTVRFQERSTYGIPRFPVGIAVRDYE